MRRYSVQVADKRYDVTLLSRVGRNIAFEIDGKSYHVTVDPVMEAPGASAAVTPSIPLPVVAKSSPRLPETGEVLSPMPGIVVQIPVALGTKVSAGETVAVIEAMKMENNIPAPMDGTVKEIRVKPGDEVNGDRVLLVLAR